MLRGLLTASLLTASLLAGPVIGYAQYMYLDANGDGIHSATDRLNASGATSLDVWLDTTRDRDGSIQSCNSHSGAPTSGGPLDLFSLAIVLQATGGTVSWGSFSAANAAFTVDGTDLADAHDTEFNRSLPLGTVIPPGLVKLGTIPVTVASGAPSVRVGTSTPLDPFGFGTGFGTSCDGNATPNTYVLASPGDAGGDWFDTDGAAAPATSNMAPSLSAPGSATAAAGAPVTISSTATDPDAADVLTITEAGAPASLTLAASPGPSPATASLSGTPLVSEAAGSPYSIQWAVNDGAGGNASATTSLTVTRTDAPPTIAAPDTARFAETIASDFGVGVSDPDGDPILTLTSSPLPAGATLTLSAFNTAGHFEWTPASGQAGSYPITFTATSGSPALSASATTLVLVGPPDRRPVVTAVPLSVTVNEGGHVSVTVTATDPDGDPLISLTAKGTQNTALPAGAVFTVNGTFTSGLFTWDPTFFQAGVYHIDLEATSVGSLGEQISVATVLVINVRNVDRRPAVTAPASVSGVEGTLLTVSVSAADPDAEAITSLTAAPLPAGATFSAGSGNTSGTLNWTPDFTQEGAYDVTFTAANLLSGSAATHITIAHSNAPPALSAPSTASGNEGSPLTYTVSATDADGDQVSLSAISLPPGAGFTDHGNNTGTFDWTPGFGQAGTYTVTIAGNDGHGGVATAATAISVLNVNRAPVANPGGPYSGLMNVPVNFSGSGSSDPDGDGLAYMWTFGDGASGTGATPTHTYTAAGTFPVALTVTDTGTPPLMGSASTTAIISSVLAARIYVTGGNTTIKLSTGKPTWCAQVEPVSGDFTFSDVRLSTLVLKYGSGQIGVGGSKTTVGMDKDGNGIAEIGACFAKTDLRTLFAGLPPGKTHVTLTIEADLVVGGRIQGSVEVDVQNSGSGSGLAASVSPNPLNPQATLTFSMAHPGSARVALYDLSGRLVRTVMRESFVSAGFHDVTIDGRGENGEKLSSGVYFYNVRTSDGRLTGRLTILK